jgi:hypothetical protein
MAEMAAAVAAAPPPLVNGQQQEQQQTRHATVQVLAEGQTSATNNAEQLTAEESLSNFVINQNMNEGEEVKVEEDAAPATACVPMSAQQHALLDAQLRLSHGREYDIDGIVKAMRIGDVIKPKELEAEARRLGLGSCAQRDTFAERHHQQQHQRQSSELLA